MGIFDCLVGVNLLREGLDLPEVAFVAVMDADIQGFLRNTRSLIQIVGRAARNTESLVCFYADTMTDAMQETMHETARRRALQQAHNEQYNIIPKTVVRDVITSISSFAQELAKGSKTYQKQLKKEEKLSHEQRLAKIVELEEKMQQAAQMLDFEQAIALRSEWQKLKQELS
jgi:excinuclease ABC subunit B